MTHIPWRLTAKNRHQLRNRTRGNRVWTTFTFFITDVAPRRSGRCSATPKFADSCRTLPRTGGRGSGAGRRLATVNMLCATTTTTTGNRLIPDGRTDGRVVRGRSVVAFRSSTPPSSPVFHARASSPSIDRVASPQQPGAARGRPFVCPRPRT